MPGGQEDAFEKFANAVAVIITFIADIFTKKK